MSWNYFSLRFPTDFFFLLLGVLSISLIDDAAAQKESSEHHQVKWVPLPYRYGGKWHPVSPGIASEYAYRREDNVVIDGEPFRNALGLPPGRGQQNKEFTTQSNLSLYANMHGIWDDFSASVSPSGELAATLNGGNLKIWDVTTRSCVWTVGGVSENYFWNAKSNIVGYYADNYQGNRRGGESVGHLREYDIKNRRIIDLGGRAGHHAYSFAQNKAVFFARFESAVRDVYPNVTFYDFAKRSAKKIDLVSAEIPKYPIQGDRYVVTTGSRYDAEARLLVFDLADSSIRVVDSIIDYACLPNGKEAVLWHKRGDVLLLNYQTKVLRRLYSNVGAITGPENHSLGVDFEGKRWCAVSQGRGKATIFTGSVEKPSSVSVGTGQLDNWGWGLPVYPAKNGDILYAGTDFGAYHWSARLKNSKRVGDTLAVMRGKFFVDGQIFNPSARSLAKLPIGWNGISPLIDGLVIAELEGGARKLIDVQTRKESAALPNGFLPAARIDKDRIIFFSGDAVTHQVRSGIFDVKTSSLVGYLGAPVKFDVKWRDHHMEQQELLGGGRRRIVAPGWIFYAGKNGKKLSWKDQEFDFKKLKLRNFKVPLSGSEYLPDAAKVSFKDPTWESYLRAKRNIKMDETSMPLLLGAERRRCFLTHEISRDEDGVWSSPSGQLVSIVTCRDTEFEFLLIDTHSGKYLDGSHALELSASVNSGGVNLFKPLDDSAERVAAVVGHNVYMLDYVNGKVLSQEWCPDSDWAVTSEDGSKIFVSTAGGTVHCFGHDSKGILKPLFELNADALGNWVINTKDGYYMTRGGEKLIAIAPHGRAEAFSTDQFSLRLNRPDIVLERIGAPEEAIAIANKLRAKRLKRMGVTEEMLKPDFHLPELDIAEEVPLTSSKDTITIPVKASDSKYQLERLRVYINNVPVNGRDGESLRALASKQLSRDIAVKLASGRNKIQISVVNSAGAESLYANLEVTCTAPAPKPVLYTLALGVSSYANPDFDLRYAAKDARDITASLHGSAGENYREVKSLCLTDKEVTLEAIPRIREFLSLAGINDTVIFFVAGHGLLDNINYDYYFATSDINFDAPEERGIAFDELDGIMAGVACLKKSMWIDTCHAGELDEEERTLLAANSGAAAASLRGDSGVAVRSVGKRGMSVRAIKTAATRSDWHERLQGLLVDLRRGSGTTVLTSSAGAEYAFESSDQQNGLFTYALIEALKGAEAADEDTDGSITIGEAADYVKKRVEELSNGKQNPNVRRVNLEGNFRLYNEE